MPPHRTRPSWYNAAMRLSRRTVLVSLLFTAASFVSPAFGEEMTTPGSHPGTITVGELQRTYLLHIPPGYDKTKPTALVLMLHGRGGNAAFTATRYGWTELSDKENFVVCYPEALPDNQKQNAWNAVFDTGQKADDVAFLSALLKELKTTLAVDPKRVYMVGHSSGAMMTYRFGSEKGADVAALGVVAGSIGSDFGTARSIRIAKPTTPVSVIVFHGKADATVGYDWHTKGGEPPIFRFVPAPESVALFTAVDGTSKTPRREELFDGNVVKETFSGGKNGTEIVFYSKRINATPLIWEFFKSHPHK